jgi:hypothetical protein
VTQSIQGLEHRTDGLWTHTGKLVVSGGTVDFPAGSISTQEIAAGAVQQLLGSYAQLTTFSLSQANVWTETPAQMTVMFGGYLVRVEFAFVVSCPTKGQRVVWGIMVDGAAPLVTLGGMDAPEANYGAMASGCYYLTPSAASHRVAIGLYGPVGAALVGNIAATLYVTEQKR